MRTYTLTCDKAPAQIQARKRSRKMRKSHIPIEKGTIMRNCERLHENQEAFDSLLVYTMRSGCMQEQKPTKFGGRVVLVPSLAQALERWDSCPLGYRGQLSTHFENVFTQTF